MNSLIPLCLISLTAAITKIESNYSVCTNCTYFTIESCCTNLAVQISCTMVPVYWRLAVDDKVRTK